MLLVLLTYIVSSISWGAISFQLTKTIIATFKAKLATPPLLIPLAISSFALFVESIYFGVWAVMHFTGNEVMFFAMIREENWFIVKLLIAISGVLLLVNLKTSDKN